MLELGKLWKFLVKNLTSIILILSVLIFDFLVQPPIHWSLILIASIGVIFVGFMVDRLRDIRELIINGPSFYPDQDETTRDLIKFVFTNKPKSADLFEYSSATIQAVISSLISHSGSDIRLLLKNPNIGELPTGQKNRICERIHALYSEHEDYDKLKVRCYEEEASIRGRKFDNTLLNIGWYTHERYDTSKAIRGHTNCTVSLRNGSEGYDTLASWFTKIYQRIWEKGHTLESVCQNCPGRPEPIQNYDEWLKKISIKD